MSTAATIPYYRSYALPWELSFEQEQRFKKVVRQVAIALLVFSIIMPILPVPETDPTAVNEIPPRFARLLLERATPPPPPVVKPKPEEKLREEPVRKQEEKKERVVEPDPVVVPKKSPQQAREKAAKAGLMPFLNELADLVDTEAVANVLKQQPLAHAPGEVARVERNMIASRATSSSGGIKTSKLSRATGGADLAGRETTRVASPVAGLAAAGPQVRSGGGMASRSREEIELVFDKNKGAIYALYNRALRRDPTLQGKLVLRLTIESSGVVSACEIVSSELNNAELERKLVQRVRLFKFEARQVAPVTTTKPIDFFPA
jgi:TonB family protein